MAMLYVEKNPPAYQTVDVIYNLHIFILYCVFHIHIK